MIGIHEHGFATRRVRERVRYLSVRVEVGDTIQDQIGGHIRLVLDAPNGHRVLEVSGIWTETIRQDISKDADSKRPAIVTPIGYGYS